MSNELTRMQVEDMRGYNSNEEGPLTPTGLARWHAICDLALRALEPSPERKGQPLDPTLVGIKSILADDKNYQSPALKIGGIWNLCERAHSYRRGKDIQGHEFIEVLPPAPRATAPEREGQGGDSLTRAARDREKSGVSSEDLATDVHAILDPVERHRFANKWNERDALKGSQLSAPRATESSKDQSSGLTIFAEPLAISKS